MPDKPAMKVDLLFDGPDNAAATVLFAHGAGAAMDSPVMTQIAAGFAARGLGVARFEFDYMAARRRGGAKRPPPKMPPLCDEFRAAIAALRDVRPDGRLIIGGKSMGGRVASLIVQDLWQQGLVQGLMCFGYPFHPRGKPDSLRTEHLYDLQVPSLICQGSRDPLGNLDEVTGYGLPDPVELFWLEDGDHDLKPRKRQTGVDHTTALPNCCEAAAEWVRRLP
ncbi:alpha/beta family hydrolase [Thalassovita mediterranea]|nr:alpha/beta family hydrolase [Thalassovita mediterranea]